jgi:hypothetical protein
MSLAVPFNATGRSRPMPGFDGTGPRGKGPMTGRARGYCVLRESENESSHIQGFAGVQGTPVDVKFPEGREVTDMPFGSGTGPAAFRPIVGCPVVYPVPGYGNPAPMGTMPLLGLYGAAPHGYRRPWWGRGFWRPRFGRAFGRGRGWGRGRGRFAFPWQQLR